MRPAAADDGGGDDGLLERRVQAHVLRRVTRGAVVVRHQESPAGEAAVQRGNAATLRREAQVRCLSFSTLAHHRPLAPCLGLLLQHLASFLSQGAEAPATRSPRVKILVGVEAGVQRPNTDDSRSRSPYKWRQRTRWANCDQATLPGEDILRYRQFERSPTPQSGALSLLAAPP